MQPEGSQRAHRGLSVRSTEEPSWSLEAGHRQRGGAALCTTPVRLEPVGDDHVECPFRALVVANARSLTAGLGTNVFEPHFTPASSSPQGQD